MEIKKIVFVTRGTRLKQALKRFNTKQQTEFFIKSRGQSFADYELENDNYLSAREKLYRAVPRDISFQEVDREFLHNYIFAPGDVVVTLGQDGLVVNVAKYLNGQPIIAVNPDPERFDGILLPFSSNDLEKAIVSILKDKYKTKKITMGRADLNDGQSILAFNDIFIGTQAQSSARYTIQYRDAEERHISSGIIVSTPVGSTGWLSSFYHMTKGINAFLGENKTSSFSKKPDKQMKIQNTTPFQMDWEERKLIFMVREPFRSQWSQCELVVGEIQNNDELILESHMPEGGVIFSDGMLDDFLQFNSGTTVRIKLAEERAELVTEIG